MDPNNPKTSPKGDLTKGPVRSHLIRLALPMTWGIFAIISFQIVDTFYISLLGTENLAALSFTFPVNLVIFSIIMGFSIATSSVLSRLIGEDKEEDVRRIATHGLILVFAIGVVVALLGLAFQDTIFRALGAEGEILTLVKKYMTIWFAGAVCISLPMVGNAAMRAKGDAFTPAMIMTIAAGMNIILDPILIFGLFGFPRLEIEGAAIATIFGNGCAALAGLYILAFRKKMICDLSALRLDLFWNSVKRLLFIALPAGLTNAIQPVVNSVILALLAKYGPEAVAAYGVVTRIEAFAFVVLMGTAVGMAPIIGQNWGAGKFDRVHNVLKLAITFSVCWSLFIAAILGIFPKTIAGLFSADEEVIRVITLFFWLVPFSYVFSNLISGWASAFNAMGLPQRSFMMIVTKMIILLIPAVYIGQHFYGVTGIFVAIAVVNTLSGSVFHVMNWRKCFAMECEK